MKTLHLSIIIIFLIGLISIHSVNGVLVDNTFMGSYVVKNDLALINNQTYYISKPYNSYDSNQTIIFHNVVFAMPTAFTSPPDPSGMVFSLVKFPDGSTEKLGVGFPVAYPLTTLSTHANPQAAFTRFMNNTFVFLVSQDLGLSSPLKQFKSGIAANDIQCNQGLQLVIKAEDNSPVCVKPQTAQKLVERGWGWTMQPMDSIKPLLPNRIIGLENDTGIVTFGNRTYYFETPHYTQDAYVNPVRISFHGVVFTLFPSGFRGGLPTPCTNNPEELQYYWADAKFADSSHELLHILGDSPPCPTRPIPTMFSTNTDPLAGLTFYDGKLKLLVSVEGMLQQNNSVFSTPIPTNETIYHDFPQPRGYSIINSTQGIIVNNDAEASNLTGFSVKSPTDLPQGYKVKLIKASKEIPMVTIFVSKYPLTNNITSEDFLWNQQGILITYDQIYPRELENFKQFFTASTNKIVTINGTLAVISDISKQYHNGYAYDMWGNLIAIQNNDTNIAIRGFFNSDELIKIATSMLEK